MKPRPTPTFNYPHLLRRAGIIAAVSLAMALALVGYLFGAADGFFGRLFGAFFVFFWLLSVTFLGVVPFVSWAAANWFGKGWAESAPETNRKRRPAVATATVRKPTRTVTRSEKHHNP
ncbi:hypothetical protein [Hymenobacter sediminicola]|uniref:Uncharacterized protein n=1 Tax=Hymenobacter sediminicola TaxID=2761579 RepID=A0A7G7W909_9BACT|nr:hypothetical protein [Hymenobacter sediminicola]QNH62852.1 hypothetical protein H4317_03270 [Hymenobacter sediminicola]